MNHLTSIIMHLASRPQGVTSTDQAFSGFKSQTVYNHMYELRKHGKLWSVRVSHKVVAWFDNPDRATGYQAVKREVPHKVIQGTRFQSSATVTYPMNEDGTPAYKVTIAPPLPNPTRINWSIGKSMVGV